MGPGKVRLLETIEQTGSIRSAAARMGMSYRRAWLLLQDIQDIFGVPVIATATGGRKGGGTGLTDAGIRIVKCYREIETKAARAAAGQMRVLSRLSANASKPAARRARRSARSRQ